MNLIVYENDTMQVYTDYPFKLSDECAFSPDQTWQQILSQIVQQIPILFWFYFEGDGQQLLPVGSWEPAWSFQRGLYLYLELDLDLDLFLHLYLYFQSGFYLRF